MIEHRIAIIGNAGGGKSTLARTIAAALHVPHVEVDRLLWLPGWKPAPLAVYEAEHERAIEAVSWVMDGLGQQASIEPRLHRATWIVLVDMPLWVHFWLAAERQITWSHDRLDHPPAGATAPPPTEALFKTIWDVDRDWMPSIRKLVDLERERGKRIETITSFDQLRQYAKASDIN